MKHRSAIAMLLIALLAVSLTFAEEQRPDIKSLVTGNNAFALDLYSILKKEEGNLFFSPYSIASALVGKELSMVIVLPEKPEGLSGVENQFTVKNLDAWLSRLSQQDVNVYLPKFKVTWGTFELNKPDAHDGL